PAPPTSQTPPPTKPEATQTAEPPALAPPVTPQPTEEQIRLQPVYSEEERRRVLAELEKRKSDIEALLHGINRRMSQDQKSVVERIRSFITVAEESAKRGDFRSAEALSERALIFARELASGR